MRSIVAPTLWFFMVSVGLGLWPALRQAAGQEAAAVESETSGQVETEAEAPAGEVADPEDAEQEASATTTAATRRPQRAKGPAPMLIAPVGFGIVCGWAVACLYCVAWSQLRSKIPLAQKPALHVIFLLTGPVGLGLYEALRRNPTLKTKLDELLSSASGLAGIARNRSEAETPEVELCNSEGVPIGGTRVRSAFGREAVDVAKRIIHEGLERRASDILIDPRAGEKYLVRYRIDGLLHEVAAFPADQGAAIVNCFKVASELDISEKRRPQDGAFIARLGEREVKFRSATAGTLYGEKTAIRVFDVQTGLKSLDNLGMDDRAVELIERFMQRSDGMMLIAGPTGSGKTTTIYAALNSLVGQGRNIVTIEDPIEYPLEHASQTEVNTRAGITFAQGLRSILRQDPDVILVGEIRDAETAETGLQASQTGHLVVSTIHSNDGPTALARLVDFGIEPFLISTGLTAVMSQRLVRVLCPSCKKPARITAELRREAARRQIALGKVCVAVGCEVCDGTGYMGRTGIFEMLPLSKKMGHLLTKKPSLALIQTQARAEKMITMRQRGIEKVLQGETTVEEVLRVTT